MTCSGDISLKCGNSYVNSLYARTSGASTPLPAPAGFTQLGCYMDQSSRTLTLSSTTDSSGMTVEKCMAFCPATATYVGLESSTECYCGTTLAVNTKVAATDCVSSCVANPAEICGGSWRLTLFQRNGASSSSTSTTTSTSASSTASSAPVPSGWTNLGCYVDQTARTLTGASKLNWSVMTPALCAANCAGYTYFGTENGNECYCGNALTSNVPRAVSECNVNCAGDASQKCGGGWRLTLYQTSSTTVSATGTTSSTSASSTASSAPVPSGWANLGCYVDQTARTLTGASKLNWSVMTPALCAANCAGYTYFGTENGNECYCGNALTSNVPKAISECNVNCAGDASQKCGGGWRLTLYQSVAVSSTSTSSTTTIVSTTSASSTTSSASATATATWTNLGCYVDQSSRTLNGASKVDNSMTVGMCQTFCGGSGFIYAGVENKVECYCGNTLTVNSPAPSTDCQAPCGGDATQICGGSLNWRMTIYKYTSPTPQPTYTSVGCFVDSSSRVLPTPAPTGTAITYTAQTCGTYCASLSLPYAGIEKAGAQCFCSDRIVLSNTGGVLVNPTECPGSWRIPIYYNVLFDSGSCSTFS
ncbi:hypothetical protein FS837_008421 [Tulasnella sp. UAMH 9824]|nr:hypothetical protein FS837_008421 [Tulasnella sp. UAMH 9824]